IGLSPSSVLILSMAAATSPRFVITIEVGVLSSPSRAAASEKESSSNVKCSEMFVGVFTSAAAAQEIVPSDIVPTPATVGFCTHTGIVAPVVQVPEQDCT